MERNVEQMTFYLKEMTNFLTKYHIQRKSIAWLASVGRPG